MKWIAAGLVLGILALESLVAPTPCRAGVDSDHMLVVGASAPNFNFSDVLSGGVTPFDTVGRGRPVLLVFLQTACQSCFREMMVLKTVKAEIPELEVVGIFLDMKAKDFQKYVNENGLPFVFGWDSGYTIANAYGVSFTPASFLIDGKRKVASVYKGFHPGIEQSLKADLAKLAKK
jgi:peroxiredoxin